MAKKFKQYASNMSVIIKNTLVEVYHSISIIKRYHGFLQQVYLIINTKIPGIKPDLVLQMFFKAINNSESSNKLVPILLVFSAYLRMTKLDGPFLSISLHTIAI